MQAPFARCGEPDRIDPDKWRPLIMSFQNFYGLRSQLHESTLAKVPESCIAAWTSSAREPFRAGMPRELVTDALFDQPARRP